MYAGIGFKKLKGAEQYLLTYASIQKNIAQEITTKPRKRDPCRVFEAKWLTHLLSLLQVLLNSNSLSLLFSVLFNICNNTVFK